jgi:hypothetical protein
VEEEGDALAHQAAGRQSRAQDGWLGLCFEAMLIFRELEVSVLGYILGAPSGRVQRAGKKG